MGASGLGLNKVKKSLGVLLAGLLLTFAFSFLTPLADASSWSMIYDTPETHIYSLAVYNDNLYAGTGSDGRVYVYDGTTWSLNYDSPEFHVYSLAVYGDNLFAGTGGTGRIYTYDGTTWSLSYDTTEGEIYSLAVYDGKLYAGTAPHGQIYVYDGTSWSLSENTTEGRIYSLAVYDGKLYAGTAFLGKIYVYDGASWSVSYDTPEDQVRSLGVYDGKLYAGTVSNGLIYAYDGTTWSLNYTSPEEYVSSLAVYGDNLYAGTGYYGVFHTYDGTTWSMSYDSPETYIYSLAVYGVKLYAGCGYKARIYAFTEFDFSISASPDNVTLTRSDSTTSTITVNLISGVPDNVSLSESGWVGTEPTGVNVSFSPSSGTPTFSSTLTFTTTSTASAGTFTYGVTGTDGGLTRMDDITVTIVAPPTAPSLVSPGNGAAIRTLTPEFKWSDVAGATGYKLEVALDNNFLNIIRTKLPTENTVTLSEDEELSDETLYYWRVRGTNVAGLGDLSSTWSFWASMAAPEVTSFEIVGGVTVGGVTYTNSTSVQLTIEARNAVEMRFSTDGTTWSGWEDYQTSKLYTLPPGDGSKRIYVQVKDNIGDLSDTTTLESKYEITLDRTLPNTTHLPLPSDGEKGYKGSVVITLTSADETSGVASIKYRIGDGEWENLPIGVGNKGSFVISTDGTHTVEYYSTDAAWNTEEPHKTFEVTVYTPTAIPPILSQYWWAILSIIVVAGIVSVFATRRIKLSGRLKRITREKAEILKLKREAEVKYFRDGSISRDTFDALIKDYERRKAELEKEERVLQTKAKRKVKGAKS